MGECFRKQLYETRETTLILENIINVSILQVKNQAPQTESVSVRQMATPWKILCLIHPQLAKKSVMHIEREKYD